MAAAMDGQRGALGERAGRADGQVEGQEGGRVDQVDQVDQVGQEEQVDQVGQEEQVDQVDQEDQAGGKKNARSGPGIIYLSRVPPTMGPQEVRRLLAPFGALGRIYLAPAAGQRADKRPPKAGAAGRRRLSRRRYDEGWVEFLRRRDARTAAAALNGAIVGGRRSGRLHDELWSIRCLPSSFTWDALTAEARHERAVRQQRLRIELGQARRANATYVEQSERAAVHAAIERTKRARAGDDDGAASRLERQMGLLRQKFKQRTPLTKD